LEARAASLGAAAEAWALIFSVWVLLRRVAKIERAVSLLARLVRWVRRRSSAHWEWVVVVPLRARFWGPLSLDWEPLTAAALAEACWAVLWGWGKGKGNGMARVVVTASVRVRIRMVTCMVKE